MNDYFLSYFLYFPLFFSLSLVSNWLKDPCGVGSEVSSL